MSNEMKDWLRENELEKEQELKPIKPPEEQVHVMFFESEEKSHALPFSKSGLSYDYWKL